MNGKIPTEDDWNEYDREFVLDLDVNYARGQFFGKSNAEMLPQYKDHVLMRAEDLHWMPKKPFQYYVFGFRDFVRNGKFGFYESSDAASAFLNLILQKLKEQPDHILPVVPELMNDVKYIASNQAIYEADADIYGNFMDIYNEIRSLTKHT